MSTATQPIAPEGYMRNASRRSVHSSPVLSVHCVLAAHSVRSSPWHSFLWG